MRVLASFRRSQACSNACPVGRSSIDVPPVGAIRTTTLCGNGGLTLAVLSDPLPWRSPLQDLLGRRSGGDRVGVPVDQLPPPLLPVEDVRHPQEQRTRLPRSRQAHLPPLQPDGVAQI